MPIRPPALDDRRYDDLVEELLSRIPAHTPEWTNPRIGDPGRTLIELFAWLGDALLYRVNLIPERQRLAFLRLLGQPLRPAVPSRGLVSVSLRDNAEPVVSKVRAGARFTGPVSFEALREFNVLPVTAGVYYKKPIPRDEIPLELEALADIFNSGQPVAGYETVQLFNDGASAKESFDFVADSADRSLWFALFAPPARPASDQLNLNEKRQRS